MNKLALIAATWVLVGLETWAFFRLANAVAQQSTQATNSGILWFVVAGIAYLGWLALFAAERLYISIGTQFVKSVRKNLFFSIICLMLCFPLAFLFIGFLLPPVIILVSALWFSFSLTNDLVNVGGDLDDEHSNGWGHGA